MMNYAWDFSQSETEEYFECIINQLYVFAGGYICAVIIFM